MENELSDLAQAIVNIAEEEGFVALIGDDAINFLESLSNPPDIEEIKKEDTNILDIEYEKVKNSKYQYTDDMSEISGFGGDYERTCRLMVIRGLIWFDKNATKKPEFQSYENIYGIINETNDDAEELSKVITMGLDCTGAMHQACIGHILGIQEMGWENYCEKSRLRKLKEKTDENL